MIWYTRVLAKKRRFLFQFYSFRIIRTAHAAHVELCTLLKQPAQQKIEQSMAIPCTGHGTRRTLEALRSTPKGSLSYDQSLQWEKTDRRGKLVSPYNIIIIINFHNTNTSTRVYFSLLIVIGVASSMEHPSTHLA